MNSSNERDKIVLVGGQGDVFSSLKQLSAEKMSYLMLETAEYGIQFGETKEYVYTPDWTILRLHAFGEGGDLLIRRDEERVFWRFVGQGNTFRDLQLPTDKPYAHVYNGELMKGSREKSLLWGKYDSDEQEDVGRGYRYEARMGKANLNYPKVPLDWKRVEIHAWRVVDTNGKIPAYWTYELAEHQPKKDAS